MTTTVYADVAGIEPWGITLLVLGGIASICIGLWLIKKSTPGEPM